MLDQVMNHNERYDDIREVIFTGRHCLVQSVADSDEDGREEETGETGRSCSFEMKV
jgi:hypothetical protein